MTYSQVVSKYEKVRIVSARALQIAQGAPPLVKVPKGVISPVDIANIEYDEGVIPIEARKRLM